ncbi:hypothetical protein BAUCODRAFT_28722 [Baudoinia panamericana UAMH 10762]|uniref:Uncharacterized protein n=1 Tax=Baudoinia panamericana (strain UAMH 10762) TaxID=717646 RepID=M2NMG0_BAUPA|nr:uncharacterized protein BAUCODRAFT_28722 [Baudoinia panamericana UAMH 10762]EMD00371.1 hypothetical protein BAUCODRAFT_28722 [Baudoinia panamericana UAMH 10762]
MGDKPQCFIVLTSVWDCMLTERISVYLNVSVEWTLDEELVSMLVREAIRVSSTIDFSSRR